MTTTEEPFAVIMEEEEGRKSISIICSKWLASENQFYYPSHKTKNVDLIEIKYVSNEIDWEETWPKYSLTKVICRKNTFREARNFVTSYLGTDSSSDEQSAVLKSMLKEKKSSRMSSNRIKRPQTFKMPEGKRKKIKMHPSNDTIIEDELQKALDTFDNHSDSDNSSPPLHSPIVAKKIEGDQEGDVQKSPDTFETHSGNPSPPLDSPIIEKQIGEGDQEGDVQKACDTFSNHADNSFLPFDSQIIVERIEEGNQQEEQSEEPNKQQNFQIVDFSFIAALLQTIIQRVDHLSATVDSLKGEIGAMRDELKQLRGDERLNPRPAQPITSPQEDTEYMSLISKLQIPTCEFTKFFSSLTNDIVFREEYMPDVQTIIKPSFIKCWEKFIEITYLMKKAPRADEADVLMNTVRDILRKTFLPSLAECYSWEGTPNPIFQTTRAALKDTIYISILENKLKDLSEVDEAIISSIIKNASKNTVHYYSRGLSQKKKYSKMLNINDANNKGEE